MKSGHRLVWHVACAVALFATASATRAADDDPDAAVGRAAPEYGPAYRFGTIDIPSAAGNTPEDDARPGEYYFRLGANAFLRKDYAHAIAMYEIASSWAYKPAQYNLGVMYARGQGVDVDLPRALAWMALAAERDDAEYVAGRELVYAQLTPQQFAQANAIWRELKPRHADTVALARAKQRWAEVRNAMTGSHLGAGAGPLLVGTPPPHGPGGAMATTGADILSGDRADGAVAYRQLRDSDNPYDPKFERRARGTTVVEPLQPIVPDPASQQ